MSEMGTVTINTCSPNSQCSARVKCRCDGDSADDFALPLHSSLRVQNEAHDCGPDLALVSSLAYVFLQGSSVRFRGCCSALRPGSIDLASPDPAQCLPPRQQQLGPGRSGAEPGAMDASFCRKPRVLSPAIAWSCFRV